MPSSPFLDLSKRVIKNTAFDQSLYEKFNVKRGLRNADGTGVLVGLTQIGDVHGYIIDECEKIPVEGKLRYRGMEINDIVHGFQKEKRFGFEEVCYLLLFGELPNKTELAGFQQLLEDHRSVPEGLVDMILKVASKDIMNKLARTVLVSYSYDLNPDDIGIENVLRQSIELIARFPVMIAYGYQAKSHYHNGKSLYIHNPKAGLSTAENFLRLIRSDKQFTSLEAEILDLALMLHAEHGGGNNSTFVTHVISSTDTDTYSAIAGAIGSLKGPKHGGANIKVIEMMEEIKNSVKDWKDEESIFQYLVKILNKEAFDRTGLIYGMGHAVYTISDPRAVILRKKAAELALEKQKMDEYSLYVLVEKLVTKAFAEVKKNNKVIGANVDFYSGLVYNMLSIPKELYTPLFALGRIAGWCAHRMEEIINGKRIIRPAYKNVIGEKKYVPLKERG